MPKKITIRGHIGYDVRAADVQKQLIEAGGKPVLIELSGPGGLVSVGLEIANLIRDYPGKTEVVLMGMVASMDSYIAMHSDKVTTHDNAVFMIHHVIYGGIGNYHALQKIVNHAKSLSTLLAQSYIAKTGIPSEKMEKLMTDETYYYGQEIVDAGFADAMIEAPDDGKSKASLNKDTAVAETRMGVEAVFARMREDAVANKDLERAAAYIDQYNPEANQIDLELENTDDQKKALAMKDLDTAINPAQADKGSGGNRGNNKPASAGTKKEGGTHMPTLLELLALPENAAAKTEHDAQLDKAAALGKKEGAKAFQEIAARVMPVLGSEYYPQPMKELAGKVLKGETPISAFDAGVASFDSTAEGVKVKEAIAEQAKQDETPPGQKAPAPSSEDGSITDEDSFQESMARLKEDE